MIKSSAARSGSTHALEQHDNPITNDIDGDVGNKAGSTDKRMRAISRIDAVRASKHLQAIEKRECNRGWGLTRYIEKRVCETVRKAGFRTLKNMQLGQYYYGYQDPDRCLIYGRTKTKVISIHNISCNKDEPRNSNVCTSRFSSAPPQVFCVPRSPPISSGTSLLSHRGSDPSTTHSPPLVGDPLPSPW